MAALPRTGRATARRGNTAKGISFSALAGVVSLVAGIVLLPVVLSAVGPAAYGTWLFLLAVASFLFFLDLGVGTAIVHFLSRSRSGDQDADPDTVASTAHAWALAACLVAIGIYILVAINYAAEGLQSVSSSDFVVMVVAGIAILSTMAVRPMSSVLFGTGFLHVERTYQVVGVLVRVVGTLAACWIDGSIVGVVLAETAALMIPPIIALWKVRRLHLVQIHWRHVSKRELKRMMGYSLGAFSVSMVGASILQFGTLVIGVLGNANQVAYFNAAFRIYASVRQIIGWLTDPFRSVLSRLYVNDSRRASVVLYDLLFVAFLVSTLGCLLLLVTLPVVLDVWLGGTVPTEEVSAAASALLAGLILNALHIPLIPASDAAGSPGAFLPHQIFWLVSYAGLAFVLFPALGIIGVALAMTAPLPILEFAYLLTAARTVKLDFKVWFTRVTRPTLPILLLGLAAASSTNLFTEPAWVIFVGVLFAVASLAVLFFTRVSWSYRSVLGSLKTEA
ncbi:oligosaccharide flippase family protein [Arthrobacter sp. NQ7]|uniref:lipopolysaccharide biosynthesis protein n=1 Tax=Arthrobacter sp. NQ7 TaxID=3032303 RepID=UPI0024102472|nr:oligosaccharide flippase family protein [Arthrobacter sp. NQ7]MDJ0455842.1 oligosaccharide flippase family protein [Arthrobacter sp. NQ7]